VTKRFEIRLDEDFFKKIEAEAKKQGKSVNQMMLDLFAKGLTYDDDVTGIPEMRLIILRYPAKCLKCGCELPPNTWAMYGKGVGAVCLDCFIEKLGDKAIVKKIMKLKELKFMLKALQKQVDQKSDELRKLNFLEIIEGMWKGDGELHKLVVDFMKAGFDKPENVRKTMDELDRLITRQLAILEETKLFLLGPFPEIKKKKKKRTYAT